MSVSADNPASVPWSRLLPASHTPTQVAESHLAVCPSSAVQPNPERDHKPWKPSGVLEIDNPRERASTFMEEEASPRGPKHSKWQIVLRFDPEPPIQLMDGGSDGS
jgi:hypothetical protein